MQDTVSFLRLMAKAGNNLNVPVSPKAAVSAWPAELQDELEERAAIMEFDGGLDRIRAEREAFEAIAARMKEL